MGVWKPLRCVWLGWLAAQREGSSVRCSVVKLPEVGGLGSGSELVTIHWKDWCCSWNSNTLASWREKLTHWKRPWCWERLKAGGEGNDSGWDGWMASPTQWTWVWVNSGSWWCARKPGMLQSMGSQRVGHDWVTELNRALLCPLRRGEAAPGELGSGIWTSSRALWSTPFPAATPALCPHVPCVHLDPGGLSLLSPLLPAPCVCLECHYALVREPHGRAALITATTSLGLLFWPGRDKQGTWILLCRDQAEWPGWRLASYHVYPCDTQWSCMAV